ncbi:AbrB/MazE/SpoVT family DNA-binding domain-containing protein [Rhizobium sp. G21]|uniref:AbrB/MazE/SpoVT family DNA-binding domain-containing protein n=1 Tax=Rhizobium sp. G21 TaxID=2758439 RepID=UPI0015FF286D|nr:AbrB/MazE/SpoVT family DNA-binding domain-containing protein [Rhizobium sp. G21]MBB1250174.1 PbsX family transcriptional regulator [Rhizobium sp. G21]
MTISTKIRRQGGAAVITIPPALLKILDLEVGAQLSLSVDNGELIARPVQSSKKHYTLAEILEGSEELKALDKDRGAWLEDDQRFGNELI